MPSARLVALFLAATFVILILAATFRIDISAARDFRTDAVVRYAFPRDALILPRYLDQSPFTVWLPSDWLVWDSLRAGRLPTWERRQGGGYSPVINLYGGVFHPARWLAAAFPRTAMPTILILEALAAAAFGWYCLARHSGYSPLHASLGAALFTVSAPMISYAHFSGSILPLAHLPWILLIFRVLLQRPSGRLHALLAFAIALLLMAGHPLIAFGIASAAASYAIALSVQEKSLRPFLYLARAGITALPLAAVILLPPLLAVPDQWSYKTATPEGHAYGVLGVGDWLVALPDVIRDTSAVRYVDTPGFFTFAGIGATSLAIIALFFSPRSPRRVTTVLAAVWFLVLVPGPWMAPLTWVPPFGYLKAWYYGSGFAFFLPFAAVNGFAVLWSRTRVVRALAVLLMSIALFSLSVRAYKVLRPVQWKPIVAGELVERLNDGPRSTGLWGQVNLPNTARITGIEDVRQSHPAFSRRAHIWWRLVDPDIESRSYPTTRVTDRLTSPLVGDFNVQYVIQDRLPATSTSTTNLSRLRKDTHLSPHIASFPLLFRTPSAEVRRIPGLFRPRAHFAETVISVRNMDEAEALLRREPAIVHRAAVVEESAGVDFPPRASGRAEVHYPADSRAIIDTDSATGGLVVLHDAFAHGWIATVGGQPARIFPVNVLSRGVRVPAGRQRIEMRYSPPGMRMGAAISVLTAIVLLVLAFRRHSGEGVPDGASASRWKS